MHTAHCSPCCSEACIADPSPHSLHSHLPPPRPHRFGPLTFFIPSLLMLMAKGHEIGRAAYWFNVAFIALTAAGCVLAVIGSTWSLATQASTFQFFT